MLYMYFHVIKIKIKLQQTDFYLFVSAKLDPREMAILTKNGEFTFERLREEKTGPFLSFYRRNAI